jgi:hypothetical protein
LISSYCDERRLLRLQVFNMATINVDSESESPPPYVAVSQTVDRGFDAAPDANRNAGRQEHSDSALTPDTNDSTTSFYEPRAVSSRSTKTRDTKAHNSTANQHPIASRYMQTQDSVMNDADRSPFPVTNRDLPDLPASDNDILSRIPGMYRLLELYSEQGSGGLVDKVVISQDSLRDLIESLSPGAYTSLTKVSNQSLHTRSSN